MSAMNLRSVYDVKYAPYFLYLLLEQRQPHESISHKQMPSFEQHLDFILSRPYECWAMIDVEEVGYVGAIYLSKQREIGIWIHIDHRHQGYARRAIERIIRDFPGPVLANINPQNETSARMFQMLGFSHIQNTYLKE